MDKEAALQSIVEDVLLAFADEQPLETRSDLQGRAAVVARKIINLVRQSWQARTIKFGAWDTTTQRLAEVTVIQWIDGSQRVQ